jgi:tRNA pseudouridine32 synthase / 23S rRNA pseudouridine746 synthase
MSPLEHCYLDADSLGLDLDADEVTAEYTAECRLSGVHSSLPRTRLVEHICGRWMDSLRPMPDKKGKMLGVLLVETQTGMGLLKAYSGHSAPELEYRASAEDTVARRLASIDWVPAIPLTHRPESEAETLIRLDELKAQAQADAASNAFADLERLEEVWAEKEQSLSRELQEGKELRGRQRLATSDSVELNRLNEIGAADSYRMRDFRKAKKAALGDLRFKVSQLQKRLLEAKWERRRLSRELQQQLHQHFEDSLLPQYPGWMAQLFPSGARTGIGECCAPKLLHAANRMSLKPVAIAEFWWGAGTDGSLRTNGEFYQACEERCQPLLGPLLSAWSPKLKVVYADEWMVVVDKPSCLLTVPGRLAEKQDSVLLRLRRQFSGVLPVHRLDYETSGLVAFALTLDSQRELQRQFQVRLTKKRYLALVEKPVPFQSDFQEIDSPISSEPDSQMRYLLDEKGRSAVTLYRSCPNEPCRIELVPVTGRSHQLRVHLASVLKNPIQGDPKYGGPSSTVWPVSRLCLHAASLELHHPHSGQLLEFHSECPF